MAVRCARVSMPLCLLWGALICWLSLMPSPPEIRNPVLGWDKVQHGAAYALLAFLALPAFVPGERRLGAIIPVVLGVILYGGLMELAQQFFTASRTADILDFTANAIGAVSASVLYRLPALFNRRGEEQ